MIYLLMAVLFFTIQGIGSKEYTRRFPPKLEGILLNNGIALTLAAGILAICGGSFGLPPPELFLALLFGVLFAVTVLSLVMAMSRGPMGMIMLLINLSMLIPVIAGALLFGESMTFQKVLGAVCVVGVLILSAFRAENKEKTYVPVRKWLPITLAAVLLNGSLGITQKSFQVLYPDALPIDFTMTAFACSALISLCGAGLLRMTGKPLITYFTAPARLFFSSFLLGAGSAGGNVLLLAALFTTPATIAYPVVQGGAVLTLWLASVLLYREKANTRSIIMLLMGISGILLLGT